MIPCYSCAKFFIDSSPLSNDMTCEVCLTLINHNYKWKNEEKVENQKKSEKVQNRDESVDRLLSKDLVPKFKMPNYQKQNYQIEILKSFKTFVRLPKIRLRRNSTLFTNINDNNEHFNNDCPPNSNHHRQTSSILNIKLLLIMIIMLNMISLMRHISSSYLWPNDHHYHRNFLMFGPMAVDAAASPSFNIDKLLEYNELVSCFGQISKEFEQCNKRGAEKAKSFLGQIELSAEWNRRLKCCGTWKLRDCWMKAAHQKCTKVQADMVYKLPELIMPALVEECQDYTPESGKCALPIWLIAVVLGAILFVLICCCSCVIYCIRRRRRHQQYRRRGLPPPGQRPYSMTISQNSIHKTSTTAYQNGGVASTKLNGMTHNGHNHHGYHHRSHRSNNHHNHHQNHQPDKMIKSTSLDQVDHYCQSGDELMKTKINETGVQAAAMSGDEAALSLV